MSVKKHIPLLALTLLSLSLSTTVLSASAHAKSDLAIAAVVGDEAVSSYDVENRVRFIISTAHLSNTPDVLAHIRPQVVRSLIDERLQVQEATKNDVTVSKEEIDQAIAAIEQQRNMPPGTISHILDAANVPKEAFTQQIKAQLSWNKLLTKKIRPQVRVSDEEIKLASQKFTPASSKKSVGAPQEYNIAVVALPVDKPSRENEVKTLGQKLVKEVRGGASFEEVSRQFSSVAASAGGKVETFWVRPSQLDPHVAKALVGAKAGMITDPVRTAEGYTIIKIYDTRTVGGAKPKEKEAEPVAKDTEIHLKEILLKLKPDADNKEADVMLKIGEEVAKHPGTCDDKSVANIKDIEDFDIEVNFTQQLMSEMPPALRIISENLKVGDISTPFASYEGIRLYMLCDKKEAALKPVDREQIYHMLIQQKMELEAQKYLRNLRRETFIDIR